MSRQCIEIAKRILGDETVVLPKELVRRLVRVDDLCAAYAGHLRSRQAVATISEQYEREQRVEKAYRALKRSGGGK